MLCSCYLLSTYISLARPAASSNLCLLCNGMARTPNPTSILPSTKVSTRYSSLGPQGRRVGMTCHAPLFSHHNIPLVFIDHLLPSLIKGKPLARAALAQSTNDKRRCKADMICFRVIKTASDSTEQSQKIHRKLRSPFCAQSTTCGRVGRPTYLYICSYSQMKVAQYRKKRVTTLPA
jgi:hypothetical protein